MKQTNLPYQKYTKKDSLYKRLLDRKFNGGEIKVAVPNWYAPDGFAVMGNGSLQVTAPFIVIVDGEYEVVFPTDMIIIPFNTGTKVMHGDQEYFEISIRERDPMVTSVILDRRSNSNAQIYKKIILANRHPWYITSDLLDKMATTYFGS